MNYEIGFDNGLEIVNVTYVGKVSLAERIQAVEDVVKTYSEHTPLKIIVDVQKLEMHLGFEEQKHFGEYLALHEGLRNAKVAVLHPSHHNPNLVIDIHAFNNGYKLAEFNKLNEARHWLGEK